MRLLAATFLLFSILTIGCDGDESNADASGMRPIDSPTETLGGDSGLQDGSLTNGDAFASDAQTDWVEETSASTRKRRQRQRAPTKNAARKRPRKRK